MKLSRLVSTSLSGIALAMSGIPGAQAAPPNATHVGQAVPAPLSASASAKIPVADAAMLARQIKAAHGKVLLINYWATWCGPCVAEFPQIVTLFNRYQAKGLAALAISADTGKTRDGKIAAFRKQQKAAFPFYAMPDGDATAYINAIDPDWQGDLPRTYLIDRSGRVRQRIVGEINAAQVDATLRKLLAEKAATSANAAPAKKKGLLGG